MAYVFNPFTGNLDSYGPVLTGTGTVSAAADGTAALPGIAFANNLNTGIYRPGADQLAISTGGTGRLFVDANGNVSVGSNSSISAAFTVVSQSNAEAINIRGRSADNIGEINFWSNDESTRYAKISARSTFVELRAPDGGSLQFNKFDGTQFAVIDSSGRLGLGTGSPLYPQHIFNNSATYDRVLFLQSSNAATLIGFGTSGGAGEFAPEIGVDSNNIVFNHQNSTKVAIDPAGNVGIGTTSPGAPLDVLVTGDAKAFTLNNGNRGLDFTVTASGGLIGAYDVNDDIEIRTYGTVNNEIKLATSNTERARIDSSGRLLVGTSSNRSIASVTSSLLQVETTTNFALSLAQNANTNGAAVLSFGKSRGTAAGGTTVVQSGDDLGSILFAGADGTDVQSRAASIVCSVDGTPDANDMPGRLVFSTTADGASSPTERMRITQEGNITIGSAGTAVDASSGTADGVTIYGASGVTISRNNANAISLRRRLGDGNIAAFYRDTTVVGTISVTTTATAYNTSSDYRLKENVVPLTGAIDRLNDLQVHRFNFIADPDTTVDGFLAHEAQAVVPECVTGTKDEVDDEGNPVYQGIDQSKLVPLLTAALQEALAEIESLKARVTALEP
jgi:hypothetical protein